MLIAGAGGHAIELLNEINSLANSIAFFDDVNIYKKPIKFNYYPILQNEKEVRRFLNKNEEFCLGVGNPFIRYKLNTKLSSLGGKLVSIISTKANIGNLENAFGVGINIMTGATITSCINIDDGSLIHINSSIHHNSRIGKFCEISPGARILGNVTIGDFSSVGSNATILPNIKIGNNVIIGAGSVINKNIPDNCLVVGVPGKIIKEIIPLIF